VLEKKKKYIRLACIVSKLSTHYKRATDRRTDRQTSYHGIVCAYAELRAVTIVTTTVVEMSDFYRLFLSGTAY